MLSIDRKIVNKKSPSARRTYFL